MKGQATPDFVAYSEIENPSQGRIDTIEEQMRAYGHPNEWIACEKVHGTNFGIFCSEKGAAFKFAKRSGFIRPDEDFFGYQILAPQLKAQTLQIRELLIKKGYCSAEVDTVIVNGEMFGGKYIHPTVERSKLTYKMGSEVKRIQPIQTDRYPQYGPDLYFYAFEIKFREAPVRDQDDALKLPASSLTYDQMTEIFAQIPGLLYARELMRGPLKRLLAFNVEEMVTTIPPLLGLGDKPLLGNFSEGLVIRHKQRGDPLVDDGNKILMLKFKSCKFQEQSHQDIAKLSQTLKALREAGLQQFGEQSLSVKSQLNLLEAQANDALVGHVSDSRLKNLISKHGVDVLAKGELKKDEVALLLAKDALKDFLKDADEVIVNMNISFRRLLISSCVAAAKKLVDSRWEKIIAREAFGDGDEGGELQPEPSRPTANPAA